MVQLVFNLSIDIHSFTIPWEVIHEVTEQLMASKNRLTIIWLTILAVIQLFVKSIYWTGSNPVDSYYAGFTSSVSLIRCIRAMGFVLHWPNLRLQIFINSPINFLSGTLKHLHVFITYRSKYLVIIFSRIKIDY